MSRKRGERPAPAKAALPPKLVPALLGVGAFALYAVSFGNGLTNWDDPAYVTENPFALHGWRGLWEAFTTPFDGAWYPLTHVVYVVVHQLFGPGPAALHVLQAALFAATVALLPGGLEAFRVPARLSVPAAVLWAVHPLRVESVVWAANLKDTLGVFFVVLAFALYARGRRWAAVAGFVLALLAKSMFFPLAALFPLADVVGGLRPWPALKRSWPFALAATANALLAGLLHLSSPAIAAEPLHVGTRLATALWTPWWYLGRILWPVDSAAVYDFALVSPGEWRSLAAMLLWASAAVLVWRLRPEDARWKVGAAFASVPLALLPVGGLIPITFPVADRYTLVPAIAVLVLVLAGLARIASVRAAQVAAGAAALALLPLNVARQREWTDSTSLWEANLRTAPDVWTVHYNLSDAYRAQDRWEDAAGHLETALRLRPERRDVLGPLLFCSGALDRVPRDDLQAMLADLGREGFDGPSLLRAAEWGVNHQRYRVARAALEHLPGVEQHARAQRLWAVVARKQGRFEESAAHAERAVSLGEPRARIELVYALADLGRYEDALGAAQGRLLNDPFASALLQGARGYTLLRMGRTDEGRAEVEAAQRAVAPGN